MRLERYYYSSGIVLGSVALHAFDNCAMSTVDTIESANGDNRLPIIRDFSK
jgi:hypothetical protein